MKGINVVVEMYDVRGMEDSTTMHFLISDVLEKVPELVGLKPIPGSKTIWPIPAKDEKTGHGNGLVGYTGTIILLESHVAIHTWPEERYIRFELSSCRVLSQQDLRVIEDYLWRKFHFKKMCVKYIFWNDEKYRRLT